MTKTSERDVAAILARGLIRIRKRAWRTSSKSHPPVQVAREQLDAERTSTECRTPSSEKGDSL